MGYSNTDLGEYAQSLYNARNFDAAFSVFEKQVLKLGFEGVLYTYIPRVLLDSNLSSEPINWWGKINEGYMGADKASKEVIATSLDHGISNGITLPLMSEEKGISWASFITPESLHFDELKDENLGMLKLCTRMFHNMVISDACYISHFLKPILHSLSSTERCFLKRLAQGKSPSQISVELKKSEKYLEQVMLKLRRKLSGASADAPPMLNRNQVLYYAGLLGLIDQLD